MIQNPKHIIVSRTDSIGDVVVSLPICGELKKLFPEVKITFLGRTYTKDLISICKNVDAFENWDNYEKMSPIDQINAFQNLQADTIIHVFPRKEIVWLAKRAKVKNRIATGRRWYTLTKCNYPLFFSRRKSNLHESQLNFKLLQPFGVSSVPDLKTISDLYGVDIPKNAALPSFVEENLILLHPLSKGSAVNWSLTEFEKLSSWLIQRGFQVAITGTKDEGEKLRNRGFHFHPGVLDLTGKLSLFEFIVLISKSRALVAASTGPLHIAAATGIHAIGLYSPLKPIDPSRWAPVGERAHYFTAKSHPENGELEISHLVVAEYLLSVIKAN